MRKNNKHFTLSVMIACAALISSFSILTYSQLPTPTVPPTNDMFANATAITGSEGSAGGYNYLASLEPNEPESCAGCKTVWYRWTAPADLSITFSVHGEWPIIGPPIPYLNDSVLGVYMGNDVGSLTMLTWNDDVRAGDRSSRVTFAARSGQVYNLRVYGGGGTEGVIKLWWEINGAESWKQYNFDGCYPMERYPTGRSKSDFGIYRPSDGFWWLNSFFSPYKTVAWGIPDDVTVPGDYFGDGCTDVAIFRPSDGNWWILDLPQGNPVVAHWGMPGDVPVRGDFDGDDIADLAIYRGSEMYDVKEYWILNSSDGSVRVDQIPVMPWSDGCYPWVCYVSPLTGDYDGDGKTDLGLSVQVGGAGYGYLLVRNSSDGTYQTFDMSYDTAVTGDFDGDGKNDMAFYRNWGGNNINRFFYRRSSDGTSIEFQWGLYGDIPVTGDYGGATGSDLCVWRPSDGNLYCYDPIGHTNWQYTWGVNGDKPIASY